MQVTATVTALRLRLHYKVAAKLSVKFSMGASKLSAFISGLVLAVTGSLVEHYDLPLAIVAAVFFPTTVVFVGGFEIWREWYRGEHIRNFPIAMPKDSEGWRIYGRLWLRMLIWLVGAATAMFVLGLWVRI